MIGSWAGVRTRLVPLCAALGVIAACGGDDSTDERFPSLAPLGTPTAPGTAPVGTATTDVVPSSTPEGGYEATVRAVEAGDIDTVTARTRLATVPCARNAWPQPECSSGEAEGTPVERLPFVGCEPAWLDPDETATVIRQTVAGRAAQLHALVAVENDEDEAYPLGPLAAVFKTSPPEGVNHDTGVIVVMDEAGAILSLRTHCRATPEELVEALADGEPIEVPTPDSQ